MDHFAKPDDELTVAMNGGTLYRNFQGYSTHAGLNMFSIGITSISMLSHLYIQNQKKLTTKLFIKTKEQKLEMLEKIAKACMVTDSEKGMLNSAAAIAAIKEHNAMQGDNAPLKTENTNIEMTHEQWLDSLV